MKVFITGIAGTLGTALTELHLSQGDEVYGCARNEARNSQWKYRDKCGLLTCDAGELYPTVISLVKTVDIVYHLSAMKHVDLCEKNPIEAWRQNVFITGQLAEMFREKLRFSSTDKACLPQGVYGATKLTAERIVIRTGGAVVRFGNLIGSSGSVLHLWKTAKDAGRKITLTDPQMTRYFIGVQDAAKFMATQSVSGKVSVPDPMLSCKIGDMANSFGEVEITGPRPGETRHQWLLAPGDHVIKDNGRIILDNSGIECTSGMNSSSAERWKIQDLLLLMKI
jgi:FlaA1/EpsC-like NDP-sugar epimerase